LKQRIDAVGPKAFSLGRLLLPIIGGAIAGTIAWIFPLTMGSGLEVLIFLAEEVRLSEERSNKIATTSLVTKTAQLRFFIGESPPS